MGESLKGTESHENLRHAFASEAQSNRRYLYFARIADIEGYPDIGGLFRDTAEAVSPEVTLRRRRDHRLQQECARNRSQELSHGIHQRVRRTDLARNQGPERDGWIDMTAGDLRGRGYQEGDGQPVGQGDRHESCGGEAVLDEPPCDHNGPGAEENKQQRSDEFGNVGTPDRR